VGPLLHSNPEEGKKEGKGRGGGARFASYLFFSSIPFLVRGGEEEVHDLEGGPLSTLHPHNSYSA